LEAIIGELVEGVRRLDNVISRARLLKNENLALNALQWKITLMDIIKDTSLVKSNLREGKRILAVEESCRTADKLRRILSYTMTSYMPISAGYRPYMTNLLAVLTEICNRDDLKQ